MSQRTILVTISAKPRTCDPCPHWRYGYKRDARGVPVPHCDLFRQWLDKCRGHVFRCDECLRAEREAGL